MMCGLRLRNPPGKDGELLIKSDRSGPWRFPSPSYTQGASVVASVETPNSGTRAMGKCQCGPEANQWRCVIDSAVQVAAPPPDCGMHNGILSVRENVLQRGADGGMMLGNPTSGLLPFADICGKVEETRSDDKQFRLKPLPLWACGL